MEIGIRAGVDVTTVVDSTAVGIIAAVDIVGGVGVTAEVDVVGGVRVTPAVDITGEVSITAVLLDITAGLHVSTAVELMGDVDVSTDVTGVDVSVAADVMGGLDVSAIQVTTGGDVRAAEVLNKGVEVLVSGIIAGILACGESSLAKTATTILLIDSILLFIFNSSDFILDNIKF